MNILSISRPKYFKLDSSFCGIRSKVHMWNLIKMSNLTRMAKVWIQDDFNYLLQPHRKTWRIERLVNIQTQDNLDFLLSLCCYGLSHTFRSNIPTLHKTFFGKLWENTWLKVVQNSNINISESHNLTIYLNCPSNVTKECFLSNTSKRITFKTTFEGFFTRLMFAIHIYKWVICFGSSFCLAKERE